MGHLGHCRPYPARPTWVSTLIAERPHSCGVVGALTRAGQLIERAGSGPAPEVRTSSIFRLFNGGRGGTPMTDCPSAVSWGDQIRLLQPTSWVGYEVAPNMITKGDDACKSPARGGSPHEASSTSGELPMACHWYCRASRRHHRQHHRAGGPQPGLRAPG